MTLSEAIGNTCSNFEYTIAGIRDETIGVLNGEQRGHVVRIQYA